MKKAKKVAALMMVFGVMTGILTGCSSKEYELSLEGNPTTGYEWTYTESKEGIIKEKTCKFTDGNKKGETGAPGVYDYTFEGQSAGEVTLQFQYARSWETDKAPLQTKTVVLSVDEKGRIKELENSESDSVEENSSTNNSSANDSSENNSSANDSNENNSSANDSSENNSSANNSETESANASE